MAPGRKNRSPADAAIRRAGAFLRTVKPGRQAGVARRGTPAPTAAVVKSDAPDPRQMRLPHVELGVPAAGPGAVAVEKTIWGSPAGKKRLAKRLVKLIPTHKVYVEPFAGSGAVFFEKPPADKEVLADADPEIASAYKALTTLSDHDLASLKTKDWTGRKHIFEALKKAAPRGKIEKLYRFLYLSHFAYGALRGQSYNAEDEGTKARTIARIEKHRDRLRGVQVRSAHYADVVKEFDGKNTFFFLDPPYPGYNVQVGEDRFDEAEFRKVLDSIKGKFLVTYGARGQLDTKGFYVKKIRTPRTIATMRGVGGPKMLTQRLISNYKITQKSLGPYLLDDVEAEVELSPAAAADLDHARALAKALAHEVNDPTVRALARAFDELDAAAGERAAALASTLLPLADRLAPSLALLPSVAKRVSAARSALAALAKTDPGSAAIAGSGAAAAAAEPARALSLAITKRIPLLKTDEERYVLGVVLEPETVDAQNDIYSAAEVRDAAHGFMAQYQNVGLMHRGLVNRQVKILESYLAPVDFEVSGAQVRKGTWLLAVHVLDDEMWRQIKSGELTGLSIGGSARRSAEAKAA